MQNRKWSLPLTYFIYFKIVPDQGKNAPKGINIMDENSYGQQRKNGW